MIGIMHNAILQQKYGGRFSALPVHIVQTLYIALLLLFCSSAAEGGYHEDGFLELGGQVVHNPALDIHRNPHQDRHSAQNRLLMSISATALSNSSDPAFIQKPLAELEGALHGSFGSGRSAAFLYLDPQNPYTKDPNFTTYEQIISDAAGSGYRGVGSYLGDALSGSNSGLTRAFFHKMPGSVIFQAAKDPAGGGVGVLINQKAEAVAHLRNVSGSNMFMHLMGGNKTTNMLDHYLGGVVLNPKHDIMPSFEGSRYSVKTNILAGTMSASGAVDIPIYSPASYQFLPMARGGTFFRQRGRGSSFYASSRYIAPITAMHNQAHNSMLGFSPAQMYAVARQGSSRLVATAAGAYPSFFIKTGSTPFRGNLASLINTPGTAPASAYGRIGKSTLAAFAGAAAYSAPSAASMSTLGKVLKGRSGRFFSRLSALEKIVQQGDKRSLSLLRAIRNGRKNVAALLLSGRNLTLQREAFLARQLAIAASNRKAINRSNRNGQGSSMGDPVLVASGFERFPVEDFSYNSAEGAISISRVFRSNVTGLEKSSFGSSWFFNYDSRIVIGRKPLISLRREVAKKQQEEAEKLAKEILLEVGKIDANMQLLRETAEEVEKAAKDIAANKAKKEKTAKNQEQSGQGGDPTAAFFRNATGIISSSDAALNKIRQRIKEAEKEIAAVNNDQQEMDRIAAESSKESKEASREAAQEAKRYPANSYPDDPLWYFGDNALKYIDENGLPTVFKRGEDGIYHAISDHGRMPDIIRQTESGFELVDKNGRRKIFITDASGISLLVAKVDTNNNKTTFQRNKSGRLIGIVDAVGRKTAFHYNKDGTISFITDPQGNRYSYTYQGSLLQQATDAMGYSQKYNYDNAGRMVGRTDPLGNSYLYIYDHYGRVIREIDKAGYAINYRYFTEERRTEMTNRLGQITQYYYNDAHRLSRIVYPDNSSVAYDYDERFNIISTTDELGHITRFRYNRNNDIIAVTDPLGNTTTAIYEQEYNRITSITNALGHTTSFSYDKRGNLLSIRHSDGSSRNFVYTKTGQLSGLTDENGNTTRLSYNKYGQLIKLLYPDGAALGQQLDILGHITAITDELGNKKTYRYNKLGSLIEQKDPQGAKTTYDYDALQRRISITNALGATSYRVYDQRGNVVESIDEQDNRVLYRYDGEENLLRKTFPNNTGIDFSYDLRNRRQRKTTFPGGQTTLYRYDKKGQKLAKTDANGNTLTFAYDALGRRISRTDGEGIIVRSAYNALGQLLRVTDGNGNSIRYSYNSRGNLIAEENAIGKITRYHYDGMGNLISKQKPDGKSIRYRYTSRNQLKEVLYADGRNKNLSYDKAGRPVSIQSGKRIEQWQYDSMGRVVAAIDSRGKRLEYGYDLLGRKTSMVNAQGQISRYSYDAEGHLVSFIDSEGKESSYQYDAMGREVLEIMPNGITTSKRYNKNNRLIEIITSDQKGTPLSSFIYSYDKVGNKLSMQEEDGLTTSYLYDKAYRLIAVDGRRGKTGYRYDNAGNRIKERHDGKTTRYRYNQANQLLEKGDIIYSYDDNGNRITEESGEGVRRFEYSEENILTRFIDKSGTITSYSHDALNRRIAKISADKKTDYFYDGLEVLQEISPAGVEKIYNRARGRIISQQQYGIDNGIKTPQQELLYAYDALGSVIALTNSKGKTETRSIIMPLAS